MVRRSEIAVEQLPVRPIPGSYWVVPGRLLSGQHPGSRSRADTMDKLRRFLSAGFTYFIDLTEPTELASYEALLPFSTPAGRRVEYLREPIPDHGVPASHDVMNRIVGLVDDALADGHVIYVHCRGGIGRSATVAACWLAAHGGGADEALEAIQELWQQSSISRLWSMVPETEEQADFVRDWARGASRVKPPGAVSQGTVLDRTRGALLGLAFGEAAGREKDGGDRDWSQHTALALCLGESLLATGKMDARDQMERYLKWRADGIPSAGEATAGLTPDVARALATYQWRGLPMAGSHDPRDLTTASLPRVIAPVLFLLDEPAAAVALAGECSRTTHQAPLVIDACRYYAALLIGAMRGVPGAKLFEGLFEPAAGIWSGKALKSDIAKLASGEAPAQSSGGKRKSGLNVIQALAELREAITAADSFDSSLRVALKRRQDRALLGALTGTLAGAIYGVESIPLQGREQLPRRELIESLAQRLAGAKDRPPQTGGAGPSV